MNQEVRVINGYPVKDEKAIRSYNTVALMKADTKLRVGQHVKTKGYYESNDGGAAEYIITDTQSESNYQENLNNGLYATLIIDKEINVKQFGAKGDGIHDDTSIIRNTVTKGKKIYFPTGTYLITETITLSNSVTLVGDGAKLGRANYNPKTIILSETTYAFKTSWPTKCYFEKLSFSGYGINELVGYAKDCDFIGTYGIYYLRGLIDNCYFECSQYGINTAVDSTIINSIFANCDVAISLHGSDNRITNNRIDWNNIGIELISANYNTITNNIIDKQTTYGITSDNGSTYNNISNNLFERNLEYHLYGAFYHDIISNNNFIKKIIIDGDETSDVLPIIAFNFSEFGNNAFTNNNIYADKFVYSPPSLGGNNNFRGNIFNGKQIDHLYFKLGTLTVNANSDNTLLVKWSSIKDKILNFANGSHFDLNFVKVIDSSTNNGFYSGDSRILEIRYETYYQIGVKINNPTSSSVTYNIFVDFVNIDPYYLDDRTE